jgi:hypothetical protein
MITKTVLPSGTLYRNDTAVEQTFFIGGIAHTLSPGEEDFISNSEAAEAPVKTGPYPTPRRGVKK